MSKLILPSSLFDDYHVYKTSTTIVINWLGVHGDPSLNTNRSIGKLVSAAAQAKRKNIEVPDNVYKAFVDSISKREKVNKWFMYKEVGKKKKGEKSQSTEKHVYFTQRFVYFLALRDSMCTCYIYMPPNEKCSSGNDI